MRRGSANTIAFFALQKGTEDDSDDEDDGERQFWEIETAIEPEEKKKTFYFF